MSLHWLLLSVSLVPSFAHDHRRGCQQTTPCFSTLLSVTPITKLCVTLHTIQACHVYAFVRSALARHFALLLPLMRSPACWLWTVVAFIFLRPSSGSTFVSTTVTHSPSPLPTSSGVNIVSGPIFEANEPTHDRSAQHTSGCNSCRSVKYIVLIILIITRE